MKIDYISADGIHESERTALEAMKTQFNRSPFSQKWHGFAGFMMIDKYVKDREIDLVLLTHDRLVMVELKNWSGTITAMQDHWLQSGNDRGRSAVKVMADKCKILSSKIKKHLVGHARNVWDEYRVVFCGNADWKQLPDDERRYILSLPDFLKISTSGGYQNSLVAQRTLIHVTSWLISSVSSEALSLSRPCFLTTTSQIEGFQKELEAKSELSLNCGMPEYKHALFEPILGVTIIRKTLTEIKIDPLNSLGLKSADWE